MTSSEGGRKRTALVTGASGGIGYELAKRLAEESSALVLVARNDEALGRIAEELTSRHGIQVRSIVEDLASPGAGRRVFEKVRGLKLEVDVLVNNAGVGTYGLFTDIPLEDELPMMQLNMVALTELTKLFGDEMVKRGAGRVLNVASTAAFQPGPLMAVYYATKAYVLSFSEALANELEGTGVTVSVLCPGPTETGFKESAGMQKSRLFRFGAMTAAKVAQAGYAGMMRGRRVIIPGMRNKVIAWSVRLGPRWLVPRLVRRMQAPGK